MSERDIFIAAIQLDDCAERGEFLRRACSADAALRERLEGLLSVYDRADTFPESPVARPVETAAYPGIREAPGTVIGPYKLLEQIGEGGFGVVFMAEQSQPVRRKVALKVLKPGMDTRQVVARFEAERQALALMDHPNIARVFDAGETDGGRPYFVMELVRGVPITDFCDHNRMGVRERLGLFVEVCRAVQHAHQKGVIHRDIKPTNVLVTLHDEKAVPKVIDFGIAKAAGQPLTDKTLFTNFAQMIGTPMYMSPEQAQMSGLDIDTRTDVYALGVLLYELLTGTTPFDKERLRTAGYDEIRRIIREEEPARPSARMSTQGAAAATVSANRGSEPRKLSALFRGELDWIVMRALEKDRNRRYESASAFAADVQRHLADEPVQACPPTVGYRLRKFARRHKGSLLAAILVTLALLGGGLGAAFGSLWHQAVVARNGEAKAKRDAEGAREQLAGEEYGRTMQVAYQECRENNVPAALALLARTRPEFRGWEWWYVHRLCHSELLTLKPVGPDGSHGTIVSTAFSPNGARVLIGFVDYAVIMDAHTGVPLLFLKHPHVKSARFNGVGTRIVTGGYDGTAKVWDAKTGTELRTLKWRVGAVMSVSFSPDGERLLTAGDDQCARVWDVKTGTELVTCAGHTSQINAASFNHDGTRIVTASGDETAIVWDAKTGARLTILQGHTNNVMAASFSPDGSRVVTASYDRTARVWDAKSGELIFTLLGHTDDVFAASYSPDGLRIVTGSWDMTARVWDAKSGVELFTLIGHTEALTSASFSPDGTRILTGSHGLEAKVWNAGRAAGGLTFRGHTRSVYSAAVSPDGLRVVSLGFDNPAKPGEDSPETMLVWDARTGVVTAKYKGNDTGFRAAAFSPDGAYIVTACQDGTARIWDSRSGEEVLTLRGHTQGVMQVAFSRDGTRILTGSIDETARLWDARTGAELVVFGGHTKGVRSVAFSPDGTQIVTAGDSTARLWDAKSGAELATITPPLGVASAAFSPDGTRVVTACGFTARVWDARTHAELLVLSGHTQFVTTASFSPDGTRILTGSWDRTVRLWDAKTGTEVLTLKGHTHRIDSAAFSPDGGAHRVRELVRGTGVGPVTTPGNPERAGCPDELRDVARPDAGTPTGGAADVKKQ